MKNATKPICVDPLFLINLHKPSTTVIISDSSNISHRYEICTKFYHPNIYDYLSVNDRTIYQMFQVLKTTAVGITLDEILFVETNNFLINSVIDIVIVCVLFKLYLKGSNRLNDNFYCLNMCVYIIFTISLAISAKFVRFFFFTELYV